MNICYRCDDEINALLSKEAERMELTKNGLIDNIIREHFSKPYASKNVVSDSRIRKRNRMRNAKIIDEFKKISEQYDELDLYLKRTFNTTWGCSSDTLEFEQTVIKILINIAGNLEKIRMELTR